MQCVDELVMLSRDRIIVSDMNPIERNRRSDGVTSPLVANMLGKICRQQWRLCVSQPCLLSALLLNYVAQLLYSVMLQLQQQQCNQPNRFTVL